MAGEPVGTRERHAGQNDGGAGSGTGADAPLPVRPARGQPEA